MNRIIQISIASLGLLSILLMTSCQTVPYQGQAREVKRKPNEGGIIAMSVDYRAEDRQVAEQKMHTACGNAPFKIIEEGEVVVGQKTSSTNRETNRDRSERQVGNLFGIPVMGGDVGGKDSSQESVTHQIKEWQISYICDVIASTANQQNSPPTSSKSKNKKM